MNHLSKPVKLYVWLLAFELECIWLWSLGITELNIYLKKASFLFFNIFIFILMAIMVSIVLKLENYVDSMNISSYLEIVVFVNR